MYNVIVVLPMTLCVVFQCDNPKTAEMDIMDNFNAESWTKGDPNQDDGKHIIAL